jgi:uncharacterized membrane protein
LGVNPEQPGTVQIAVSAVMVALVAVTTMLIQVPIPATDGFFNIGDAVIMVAALTFGPVIGGVAGGVGSSLADLLGGWYVWVIPTLLIKGAEGLLTGWIARRIRHQGVSGAILAWAVGALVMVFGYFAVQVLMYGVDAALVEMPFNVVQVTVGGVIGLPVSQGLKRRMKL